MEIGWSGHLDTYTHLYLYPSPCNRAYNLLAVLISVNSIDESNEELAT